LADWTTGIGLSLLLASWLPIGFTPWSRSALIVGVILLDLAVQAVHVTNQSVIFAVRPEARSRLVAGYMVFYSLGSGIGSITSTAAYAWTGWTGVCLLGAALSALALLFWALTIRLGR
jgi:predicted MFS family arabinose efflux permease